MLRSRIYLSHSHLDSPEIRGDLRKATGAEPFDILDGLIYGIDTLLSGCVAAFSLGRTIQHHQSLLRHRHFHLRRFADNTQVNVSDFRKYHLDAAFAADLFFSRGRPYQSIRLRSGCQFNVGGKECNHRCAVVIGTKSIETSVFIDRNKRVAGIAGSREDSVDVGIEQNHWQVPGTLTGFQPEIVAGTVRRQSITDQPRFQHAGDFIFLPAERWYPHHLLQKLQKTVHIRLFYNGSGRRTE